MCGGHNWLLHPDNMPWHETVLVHKFLDGGRKLMVKDNSSHQVLLQVTLLFPTFSKVMTSIRK